MIAQLDTDKTAKSMYSRMLESFAGKERAIALSFEGKIVRAKSFLGQINNLSSVLRNEFGIKRGDVVAMNLPNMPSAVVLFYAINKCGAIANLLHPFLPCEAVLRILRETKTKLFVTLDTFYDKNLELLKKENIKLICAKISDDLPIAKKLLYRRKEPKIEKDVYLLKEFIGREGQNPESAVYWQAAAYMHSTGTTGEPKTVVLSNLAVNTLSEKLAEIMPDVDASRNKFAMVLPLFHGFGFGLCMHTTLLNASEVCLIPRFNIKNLAKTVGKRKATFFAGIPSIFERLLKLSDRDFKKLRWLENVFVGGEKLSRQLKLAFDNRLKAINSKAELVEGYGLTETVTVCCVTRRGENEKDAVGYPLNDVKLAVIGENSAPLASNEQGEICVAGDILMDGYLGDTTTDAFVEINGQRYVKTGDIGYLDTSGKLYFVDRRKRVFKISGINVFPSEIESIVRELPGISDCLAVYRDSNIVLFVEAPNADRQPALKELIHKLCSERLLPYAVPKIENIKLLPAFPKNAVGKADITALTKTVG